MRPPPDCGPGGRAGSGGEPNTPRVLGVEGRFFVDGRLTLVIR
jgi:hypothetical protein